MNTVPSRQPPVQGSVLMITVLVITVIGVVLGSYLFMIHTQSLSVARAQAWNAALAIAEAGIEEAMAQLNPGPLINQPRNANGWTISDGLYRPSGARNLANGFYRVGFSPDALPTVYSTGYARAPISGQLISRTVTVTTTNSYLFRLGIGAATSLDLKGNGINIDSYDSSDPALSTNGKYDPLKANDNGDIGINSSVPLLSSIQNANIKGKIRTAAGGSVDIGNGSVGDSAWVDAKTVGIKPGWLTDDLNVEFPDVTPPFTSGWSLPTPTVAKGTNVYSFTTGDYVLGALQLSGNDQWAVAPGQIVRVYVMGTFDMKSGSAIYIDPTATLKMYVAGASATYTTVNAGGFADSFQYFGLPSNTSLTWNGNDNYVGTIYAPEATITMGGGGSAGKGYDYQGAAIANKFVMNGHFSFHYDEALRKRGVVSGLVVNSWNEL